MGDGAQPRPAVPLRSIDWEELISVDGDLSVRAAAVMMTVNGVGALIVTGFDDAPAVVTERDITRAVATGVDLDGCSCGAIAEPALVTAEADETIVDVAERLLEEGIRHIPVVCGDDIVTVLSVRDLLAAVLAATRAPDTKE